MWVDTSTATRHQLSVAVLHTISNLTNNTINDPAPPQLVKVLTDVLWQSCCESAQFHYFQLFFLLCCLPYHTAAEEDRHLWLTHSMQSFGFKYPSWNSWKLRWHWVWAKNVHCKQDCAEGLSSCQLLPSLPQGSRLWVTAPKTCVHSMPEICLSQLLSKVTTVTGLKKWVEGREVQVSFGCFPPGYWALSSSNCVYLVLLKGPFCTFTVLGVGCSETRRILPLMFMGTKVDSSMKL